MPDFSISIRNKAAFYPDRYGYQRRGTIPTSIVVHSTEGVKGQSFASASNYLYHSAAVSAHFLVGRDGFIEQQLSPKTIQAWHAGEARHGFGNAQSIGIELLHKSGEDWPAIQKDALAWLLRRLMTDHAIPSSRIETHGQIAIPGPYIRKTDPTNWPYADFRAWIAALDPVPPADDFARWGPIGRPEGDARGYAIPRAWLANQVLGACIAPETYSASGEYSIAEFTGGIIYYLKRRNVALVERF